jgi:hypothetical protein
MLSGEPYWGEAACEIGVSNNAAKTTAATMASQRNKVDIGDAPASIKHGVPGMDARSEAQMTQEKAGRADRLVSESFFDETFLGLPRKIGGRKKCERFSSGLKPNPFWRFYARA